MRKYVAFDRVPGPPFFPVRYHYKPENALGILDPKEHIAWAPSVAVADCAVLMFSLLPSAITGRDRTAAMRRDVG